jgi:hypothetical protein
MAGYRFPRSRSSAAVAAVLLPCALAACGSSSHPASTTTKAPTTTTPVASTSGGVSVTRGPVHATLTGQNHDPVADKYWTYTVHVVDAKGRPLSGTLDTAFAFQGAVVGKDTPPTHRFSHGRWEEKLKFPARSEGYPLDLRVVVHTPKGSATLEWPVTVRK